MKITVTYNIDEEMMDAIDDTLSYYEPSDFEHQDDRDVFLNEIAHDLIYSYPPLSLQESIVRMLEKYLKKKGWI